MLKGKNKFLQNINISLIRPHLDLTNQLGKKKLDYVINCKLKNRVQKSQNAYTINIFITFLL